MMRWLIWSVSPCLSTALGHMSSSLSHPLMLSAGSTARSVITDALLQQLHSLNNKKRRKKKDWEKSFPIVPLSCCYLQRCSQARSYNTWHSVSILTVGCPVTFVFSLLLYSAAKTKQRCELLLLPKICLKYLKVLYNTKYLSLKI